MEKARVHHIESLQSLRFIFIFLIFISHFSWDGSSYWDCGGDIGVCFFFMLSGFVLSLTSSCCAVNWGGIFMRKRLARIYPAHLLALLLAFVCMPWGFNGVTTVTSLALVQSWVPCREVYFGANPVAWFLSDLLLLYALFPLLKRAIFGCRRSVLAVVVAVVAGLYLAVLVPVVPADKVNWVLYVFPPLRLLDFCIGILLARLFKALSQARLSSGVATLFEIAALALVVGSCVAYPYIPERYATASFFWIPCGAVIIVFAVADSASGAVSSALKGRCLLWLGALSFEFYLVHVSVIAMMARICSRYALTPSYGVAFAVAVVATIVVSAAFKQVVGFSRRLACRFP